MNDATKKKKKAYFLLYKLFLILYMDKNLKV